MSNNTPPKEIYLGNEFIEIIEGKMRSREFASTEMIYNEQIKYLSEESVIEMLAEKDGEIEKFILWKDENRWFTFSDGKWNYTFENGTSIGKSTYEKHYRKTTSELFELFKSKQP